MANKTTKYGSTNNQSEVTFADYWHGSHTFVDNFYRLAPKHKFLYHVSFTINSSVAGGFVEKHGNEISLLAKYADLPKFDIETETKQQYNRKKIVHTRLDYSPVMIRFHDDNEGVTTRLWQAYYDYYFADTQSLYPANNVYKPLGPKKYGLDNGSDEPFFTRISISELSRHTHHTAHLIMPKITGWQHDSVDASAGSDVLESTMQLQYEAVKYETGDIVEGSAPKGFATPEHYDQEKSFVGNNSDTLNEGPGSMVNNLSKKFEDKMYTQHNPSYNNTLTETLDAYTNTRDLSLEGHRPNGLETIFNQQNNKDNIGINGVFFSSPKNTKQTTTAVQNKTNLRTYDNNYIISTLNQNVTLRNNTVEKYYNLTTSNTDYASLTTTSKDYYLNEMYTALRADNPKILKLASTALNTV
jgi:hypothetical protein